jgi:class 3 adenylate cyclase/pimeloyl-ACP methyl ester carboxylesterase
MQLDRWLSQLGLQRYAQAFRDAEITYDVLAELTDADLRELGLPLGSRKAVLKAIHALGEQSAESTAESASPAAEVASSEPERRQLTVMFVDLVGSTELSRKLDPEDLQALLGTYHEVVRREITRFEGHVAKLMGDGVLAYFGWPRAHEDEAERAVRAALRLVQKVGSICAPNDEALAARVGIATGLVVVGKLVGRDEARERAVVGETPNLAARLQQLAQPGTVVVAEHTLRLLGRTFEYTKVGRAELKGFTDAVRAFRILGPSREAGRFESLRGESATPLVGRDQELELLLERWARAGAGEGQVVLLAGEPGVGKSRLVLSLRERVRGQGRAVLRYQCSPHHTSSALHPIIAQLEQAAEFSRSDDATAKYEKLSRLLGSSEEVLTPIADLLELRGQFDPAFADMTPHERKARIFKGLFTVLERLAASGPVLVVVEDAHWIDPTTEELFGLIVERAELLAVMLVVTFRFEFKVPWPRHGHVTSLTLSRLNRGSITEISQHIAGKPLPDTLLAEIVRKTDGVPLFIEELTKSVVESGLLRDGAERYEFDGPLPELDIPATLQDSLLARLDRLSPAKEVAQIGAAIGREFRHELVTEVASLPPERLAAALDDLIGAELVFRRGIPPNATYVFKHALVQDAAYSTLLKSRRRDLHRRIAVAIEAQSRGLTGNEPEILARHYAEAGLSQAAARLYLVAGQSAKSRHAVREASTQLELCLLQVAEANSADELREVRREAWLTLGDLAGLSDDLDRANACYDQALAASQHEAERGAVRNRHHRLQFTSRDGARLAYYEHGTGDPTVVFVNPLVYGLAIFQPILERLCQEFRVITIDGRGAGRSDPLVRPYGITEHAADLGAVIEAAGAAPIVGVGISRGSNQLLHLTYKRPDLVRQQMIVGTPVVPHASVRDTYFNPEFLTRRAEAYARKDVEELLRIQAEFVYTEEYAAELRRMAIARRLTLSPETILSFYDPDPGIDVEPLLESISAMPTLVAHGGDDRLNSLAAAEYLATRFSNARLYIFEDKGHNPMFTATEEFCDVLRRFIIEYSTDN